MVGQLGWSKNSRTHFELILCCSVPNITPHIKFHPIRMKNAEVQIFEILERFQKSATPKLLKQEHFAWSHWIRKYLFYFGFKFRPRPQAAPEAPQLPQTSAKKNGKPSISRIAQKIELVIRLFWDKRAHCTECSVHVCL